MKVLITGSSGVVGRALVQSALANTSHELVLVDLQKPRENLTDPRVTYRTADLLDYDALLEIMKDERVEGVVHLAGLPNPRDWKGWKVHNTNVCLSYNALGAAAEAGVSKVVLASSVNAIGGAWSPGEPQYRYFPIDESHPCAPSDPYSLSKQILELQAQSIARANPEMSISSLRLHAVLPSDKTIPASDAERARKDLWGWTDSEAAARACLMALEVAWKGSEEMFVIMDTHRCEGLESEHLRKRYWPHVEVRTETGRLDGRRGFYDCSKAERLLGWKGESGQPAGR